jgi:hypothetical protein
MVCSLPLLSSILKQKVPLPAIFALLPTNPSTTGPLEMSIRFSKQSLLPDIVQEAKVSTPIWKESVSNLALTGGLASESD